MNKELSKQHLASTSIVCKLHDGGHEWCVAFRDHSGIFRIAKSDKNQPLIDKLEASEAQEEAIAFTYDRDLNIQTID